MKLTEQDVRNALHRIQTVRQTRLREIRSRYEAAVSAAVRFADPDLTPDALARRREEAVARARQQLAADLDQAEGEARFGVLQVEGFIKQTAQAAEAQDTTAALLAETRQQRAWDRARSLLDAGRTVREVIGQADVDTLRALRVELPTYLAAKQVKPTGLAAEGWEEPDPTLVIRTVDQALAAKLPGDEGAALRARLELEALRPGLTESVAALRRKADGVEQDGDDLASAVRARLLDQEAGATLPEPAAA